jgi:hypothetical protein
VKLVAVSRGAAKQVVVSCQENVGLALFGACRMQSVERAEPKPLKEQGSLGRARSWDHDFIREGKQCGNIVPALSIQIAADLNLKCGAAHPTYLFFMYQTKNTFHRFGFRCERGLGSDPLSGGSNNRHPDKVSIAVLLADSRTVGTMHLTPHSTAGRSREALKRRRPATS